MSVKPLSTGNQVTGSAVKKSAPATDAKSKIAKLSDETLAGMFSTAFKGAVGDKDSKVIIPNVECSVKRKAADPRPVVEVSIFEMAGTTPKDKVCTKDKSGVLNVVAKNLAKIQVELHDGSKAIFRLNDCLNLSATSFMLCYQLD